MAISRLSLCESKDSMPRPVEDPGPRNDEETKREEGASIHDFQTPGDKNDKAFKDILIPCSKCQNGISQSLLLSHQQQHQALTLLGYKQMEYPKDIEHLALQKNQTISKIKSVSNYKMRKEHKINHSYEILKEMLFSPTTSNCKIERQICHQFQVYQHDTVNDLIGGLAVCSDRNMLWQKDMEDTFVVLDNYGNRANTSFIGVFDGCNGKSAACTLSEDLPVLFLSQLSNNDPSYKMSDKEIKCISSFDTVFNSHYKDIENGFTSSVTNLEKRTGFEWIHVSYAKAFWRMERILRLGRNETSKMRWSGSTAVTCLIEKTYNDSTGEDNILGSSDQESQTRKNRLGMLHMANIGNIQAVLCRTGKSYRLTKNHSTSSTHEKKRVVENRGSVSTNEDHGLVGGFSKATRGLGFHGDTKLKNSIIPAPHTISIPIYDSDQFLVVASNGLWEVLSKKQVVAIAIQELVSFLNDSNNSKPKNAKTQNDTENETNEADLSTSDSSNHCNLEPSMLNKVVRVPVANIQNSVDNKDRMADLSKSDHYDPNNLVLHNDLSLLLNTQNSDVKRSVLKDDTGFETGVKCSDKGENHLKELYGNASIYVCKQLVKTAMLVGSQTNVTVCLILLPGCENMHKLQNDLVSNKSFKSNFLR
ncbi:protein phosphatase 2C-like domain-containing protein 1 [Bombina bombina]|uniref:protein phosphatase 2C-like domain-containing protein 1 n=1 Tax=Bombina bombina TaxID=8345 RepID=UPI00235B2E19|nr:protein phosphatase 2C-like domain-containing protein 1 [Bombina bombina]